MEQQEAPQSDTQKVICRNCGAKMRYDPANHCLHCDYCGSDAAVGAQQGEIKKYDIGTARELLSHDWGVSTVAVKCRNCGAQVILEADKTADFCVFCGSPMIERENAKDELAPGYVLPFQVTDAQAGAAFKNWLRHRSFAPHRLKSGAQMQRLKGVYIPHYAFDCSSFTKYTASAGSDSDSLSGVSGELSMEYKNIVVPASVHINKALEGDFGFMLGGVFQYAPQFISGFLAEKVSVTVDDGWKDAKAEAERRIRGSVEDKIKHETNASVVQDIRLNVSCSNVMCVVLLLPVWLSVYSYGKKQYEFMVNGQSGRVKGKAPVSPWKILRYLAVTGVLFWLINLVSMTVAWIVAFVMVIVMIGLLLNNNE